MFSTVILKMQLPTLIRQKEKKKKKVSLYETIGHTLLDIGDFALNILHSILVLLRYKPEVFLKSYYLLLFL